MTWFPTQMGQSTTRLGVGAQTGVALPERRVPAGGVVAHSAPARSRALIQCPTEPLPAGERTRGASSCAEVGRAGARTAYGGSGAQSSQSHRALGHAKGCEEARSQRH